MINFNNLPEFCRDELQELFSKNEEAIDDNDWDKVYDNMPIKWTYGFQGLFTEMLYESEINPLDYLDHIPEYYMSGESSITIFTVPAHIKVIGAGAFSHARQLQTCIISDNVEIIKDSIFDQCYSLVDLTIGANVREIGNYVFTRCDALKKITYRNTMDRWRSINKGPSWKNPGKRIKIICTDGEIIE